MKTTIYRLLMLIFGISALSFMLQPNHEQTKNKMGKFKPLSYAEADRMADSVLALMTLDEKLKYIGGDKSFFIRGIERLNLNEVYMSDATAGVHIRESFRDVDLSSYQLKKSTAFPCPLSLAATWDSELAYKFAEAIGEDRE